MHKTIETKTKCFGAHVFNSRFDRRLQITKIKGPGKETDKDRQPNHVYTCIQSQ